MLFRVSDLTDELRGLVELWYESLGDALTTAIVGPFLITNGFDLIIFTNDGDAFLASMIGDAMVVVVVVSADAAAAADAAAW